MRNILRLLLLAIFSASLATEARAEVMLSEIMYHPPSELTTEEWVELYNPAGVAVDLSGWKFTNGVAFTFPNGTTIAAGGYLVVAANSAVFHADYPSVANYVGGWTGQLSNSANRIELDDNLGLKRDEVSYADDGDWAVRKQDVVADYGHKGWGWQSSADGDGKSLELINPNPAIGNDVGQNWGASVAGTLTIHGGTPGAVNSIAANDIAPVILDVAHFPLVPTHTDQVIVTATITDEQPSGVSATLFYRNDGVATWSSIPMFDDGAHGDALASDHVFGASLPPKADKTIVEFYISAQDAGAKIRTWPAPAINSAGTAGQFTNCLYQVDETAYAGAEPLYKVIMRAVDKAELVQINANTPVAPFSTSDQTLSHAKMNTTWVTRDGVGSELRYLVGTRNRGHGSRSALPQSLNVSFENAHTWKNLTALNLNTQTTHSQLFGSALFRQAGLATPDSRQVQVRWNALDHSSSGSPSYGFYVANEVQNSEFADHHFPLDSSGNIYRGNRTDVAPPANTMSDAYLEYQAPVAGQLPPDPYRTVFFKKTNASEDKWTDLIGLTQALAKGRSDAAYNVTYAIDEADYVSSIQAKVDVAEWARFFATETLVDNSETNISSGYGDDYYLYFGVLDPRAKFIPYDLDTICGQGDNVPTPTQHGLFRMIQKDNATANGPTPMNAFFKTPAFSRIYYGQLKSLLDGAFAPANFNPLVDQILTGVVPTAQITSIKTFQTARTAYIASLVPLNVSVTNTQTLTGTALPTQSGFTISVAPRAATTPANVTNADPSHIKLIGKASAITTASVKVNGVAATWSAWQAQWTAASVTLTPGTNRILIQSFNSTGAETDRAIQEIWYDDASVVSVSGSITGATTWTAAGGPYNVTATATIPSGATLTIQPGTVVYLNTGVNLVVANGGRLLAEGTEGAPIHFTRTPGATTNWGSIQINGAAGSPETRIAYAHLDFAGGSPQILCSNATVYLDHLTFGSTATSYLHLDSSSFLVSNCTFPNTTAAFEPVHGVGGVKAGGYGIVRDSYFGISSGYSDIIDFTGGSRPNEPLVQFYNNVFMGSTDDILDLDGTDAWIEGNIFLHSHKNGSPDTSSPVSGGEDQGTVNNKSEITIIGNIFFDCDCMITAKEGNFFTMLNNTMVHQNRTGGTETRGGVINLADDGIAQGVGTYVEGNIIDDVEALARTYSPPLTSVLTFNNNLLPFAWSGPGSGNTVANPRFKHVPDVSETNFATFAEAQVMRDWFSLLPGSPAIGTGPNGRDKGGVVNHGASIGGEPRGTTNLRTATLTVGTNMTGFAIPTGPWPLGSGFTKYQWKLDSGAFSSETPIGTPISLSGLANGPHTVTVIGKNDVGLYQNDSKLGPDGTVTISKTWTVDPTYVAPPAPGVRINEVIAKNTESVPVGSPATYPDAIELYNPSATATVLVGLVLTDGGTPPNTFTFPAGTPDLAPGAFRVIYADTDIAAGHTGFGIKQSGDSVTLKSSTGVVIDTISFGAQLADYSIGRRSTDAAWDLCVPTFGSANIVAAQSPSVGVQINEWLTDERVGTDFIELFNPASLPVNIGNHYLTNNPVENITVSPLSPLTFIAPSGYVSFKADSDPQQGADHLAFKLTPTQGEIGFFDPAQNLIDSIVYGSQSTDVSEGRTPNGTSTFAFFNQPTPGAPNPGVVGGGGGGTTTVHLVPANQTWRYYVGVTAAPPNDAQSRPFTDSLFTDTSWNGPSQQLLYIENAALTNGDGFTKASALPGFGAARPYQTYYFRTHFTYSGALNGVTLNATLMLDDGCVLYLNGQEITPTAGRVGMASGTVAWSTLANRTQGDAAPESVILPASQLVVGDNVLVAEVHQADTQSSGSGSSDIVWGMKLDADVPVAGAGNSLVLNEVLALHTTAPNPDGSLLGWIELHNTSGSSIDISDVSLTDNVSSPRKWIAPASTIIPSDGYLVLQTDALAAPSATNAGFGLSPAGGGVFLFRKIAEGGGLEDSVTFGQQLPDLAVGRVANGVGPFVLTLPSRGGTNVAAGLGSVTAVKVNEWLANPSTPPGFFELYNTSAQPILLSGNFLTDNLTKRDKFQIPALSFIGGAGTSRWQAYIADNDTSGAPGHVNFALNPSGEAIGLFSASGTQIEAISFGPQSLGISGGRFPDGTATIADLMPTPGAANVQASTDTDHDGIPDAWELAHGLNPNDPNDGALDADGDGQSNLSEYLAGTDPQNPADRLTVAITSPAPGQTHIKFTASANNGYTIQYKAALTDATWIKFTDIAPQASAHAVDVTDATPSLTQRFYRVVTPIQP